VRCFRVTPTTDPVKAFDGIGASHFPGRWNQRNERAVYVTTSLPLGVLEVMVQDSIASLNGYGFYPLEIPDDVVLSTVDVATLSRTWRTARAGRVECRAIGEAWRARRESVGIIVPSAVVPEAFAFQNYNIVLDPTHTEFGRLVIDAHIALDVDARVQTILAPPRA
jgi:RES domain-containing protein